ncbi:TonB-dependent receptor [Cellvibrio zantedeschiae]|uniref:TonB-dependent receptor n=1 Tax=Cellvibrio zantedeschiae TaxID=1237077 RepID=A0ABQ3B3G7_9GAMM|nr:TonB-dependent receptor [Cellvibrio zantedeschiae]GGY73529.1 TonB-dependent receptor [Cellvibrio zantedeschiae]
MINKNQQTFLKKRLPVYIKLASSMSLVFGAMGSMQAFAAEAAEGTEEIVITGQRASVQSAQEVKKKSNVIVDSIVAEDIGKLPDRSVTEALQRVPGVSVGRYTNNDAEHPAAEGSGVAIRGLTQVRAELNGRDVFSAASGRGLSFEDVPAELMYAVDTYKSPSADMIEGGLGGTVNLRTRMPFDSAGQLASFTIKGNYGDQIKETNGEYSGLYSNRWSTDAGEFGFLIDLSTSKLASRSDQVYSRPFLPRTIDGKAEWVSKGVDWRRNDYFSQRDGKYAAFQWAPNDQTEIYLTGFQSKLKSEYDENAFFLNSANGDNAIVPASPKNWQYGANGEMISGDVTVANPADWGLNFGTSTRWTPGTSTTTDYSTGIKWSPDDHWKFSADLQYVKAEATKDDYTLGVILFPPTARLEGVGTEDASIYIDPKYMTNYANYTLGQAMTHFERNEADAKTGRFDAEYSFDDSIIKSVKAGARYSEKTADNINTGYDWKTRYDSWTAGGGNRNQITKVTADQANKYLALYSFNNFQRGDVQVPAAGYIYSENAVKNFWATTEGVNAGCNDWYCGNDKNALKNEAYRNTQEEKTASGYVMVNYGFDDLSMPVDGNFGVRVVQTDNVAHGYLITKLTKTANGTVVLPDSAAPFDAKNDYTHVLPSFNLRMKATDDVFIRFAASKAIWAPSFSDMQARITLGANLREGLTSSNNVSDYVYTLTHDTNPYLEPMTANQFDLSAEWYFDDKGGMAHLALFNKKVDNFFRRGSSNFNVNGYVGEGTWLANVGSGDINGAEFGVSKFFDTLPAPFDGLGVDVNYTYIDSKANIPLPEPGTGTGAGPIDTDKTRYGQMPIDQLSKNAFNVVGMYEKDGISARLAYSWRSKYLIAWGSNGFNPDFPDGSGKAAIPIYNDDYGQLDASIGYTFMDNYTVTLEASNLLKAKTIGIMDQNKAGDHVAYSYAQDARYSISLRAKF